MATGATEFVDSTTADVFIPELWSSGAIVARENSLVFAMLVDRKYQDGLTHGDTIHVPSVGNLAARSKTKASNSAITFETVTETNTDISVATWEYAAMAVESIVKIQANRDMFKLYSGKMGYALGLSIDDVLAGLPDNVDNTVGTLAVELSDDDILRAIQYLDDANVPADGRVFVLSPAEAVGWMKKDKFVHNDYTMLHGTEKAETSQERAYVKSFIGTPAYKSVNVEGSNAAGHDNVLFQREAFALVVQMTPTPHHMYDIDYLVDKVVLEQLSGTAEMRDDHAVYLKGA